MLVLRVTLDVIISDTWFYTMRKHTWRNQETYYPITIYIYMSVTLAPITVDSVLPWGCRCEVGRFEEPRRQDLPGRC